MTSEGKGKVKVARLCLTLCGCSPPGSFLHEGSPEGNTGVGCQAHLQGIFPQPRDQTQVSRIAGGFFIS